MNKNLLKDGSFAGMCSRAAVVRFESINEEDRSIETVMTTEAPAIVIDWDRWEVVREVLIMKGIEIPETKKVPLLDSHSRFSVTQLKGSVVNIRIEGTELIGDTVFSKTAEDEWIKVKEGHLDSNSVGYQTYPEHSVLVAPGEKTTIDGVTYKNDYADKLPFLIRKKSTLKEDSLVIIGADSAAKYRAEMVTPPQIPEEFRNKMESLENKNSELTDEIKEIKKTISFKTEDSMKPDETKDLTREEQARMDAPDIIKYGKDRFKGEYRDLADTAVMKGQTLQEFERALFTQIEKDGGASEIPATIVDMSEKELKEFDIARAVKLTLQQKDPKLTMDDTNSLELEISADLSKTMGTPSRGGDFYIPNNVIMKGTQNFMQERAHSVGTNSEGGYLVADEHRPDLFINLLRKETILGKLGITILSGLKGNISIPKQLTGTSFAAIAENSAADASYVTLGQVQGNPKTGSATTKYGRQLLLQSTPDISTLLMNDLIQQTAIGIDNWGINGTGSGNQPTGLMNQSGITAITPTNLKAAGNFVVTTQYIIVSVGNTDFTAIGASANVVGTVFTATGVGVGTGTAAGDLTWQDIVSFRKNIFKNNAMSLGGPKWAMSADVEEQCLIIEKFASTGKTLMDDVSGKMLRADSEVSNQIDDSVLIQGIWNQFYMLEWGVTEILVNPYSATSKAGEVELTIFKSVDFILRQAKAFAINSSVKYAA